MVWKAWSAQLFSLIYIPVISNQDLHPNTWLTSVLNALLVKLRLGASIPRSVGLSVGLSVLQKLQKKLQNFTKHCKALQNIWEDRQGSFGSMPEPKGDK